jgi:hypothetical protein
MTGDKSEGRAGDTTVTGTQWELIISQYHVRRVGWTLDDAAMETAHSLNNESCWQFGNVLT